MQRRLIYTSTCPTQRLQLEAALQPEFEITSVPDCQTALACIAEASHWQLLLIDAETARKLGEASIMQLVEQATRHQLLVVLTGTCGDTTQQQQALHYGCVGDIADDLPPALIKQKLTAWHQLASRLSEARPATHQNLVEAYETAILCMAHITRLRDHSTGNHTLRCQQLLQRLADQLRDHPAFRQELCDDATISLLCKSAALHDIGKVGIPEHILQKPGSLSAAEYEIMKRHTRYGYEALRDAEQLANTPANSELSTFMRFGKEITLSHHERWDGKGYPQGLKAEQIPVSARLMSVTDVYDAITSNRPYQPGRSHQRAVDIISGGRGSQFDPDIVDAFLEIETELAELSRNLLREYPSLTLSAEKVDALMH